MSMTRPRRPLVAAASLFVPALAPAALSAQQDPSPAPAPSTAEAAQEPERSGKPQNRVVVTASGFREDELDTPYTFQQLDSRDITDRGYRTLPEALAQVPGVMVQKTAHGHGSPYIRGFTGRQNLITIDGIRFNNSIFRGGPIQYWNTIDSFAVDHLEVVKSQGSVLYGSDAVGGTVNVFTKSSNFRDEARGRGFQHGAALYRFDTNGGSHTGRLEGSVGEGGKFGLFVGVTYRDFGDIRDRVLGTMEKTGYEEFDYDLRFDAALGDATTVTIAHQRLQQDDVWRTHNTVFFEPWQGTSLGNPDLARVYDQDRDLTYVKFAGEELGGAIDAWRLTFSYQNFREDFSRIRNRTVSGTPVRDEQSDVTKVSTAGVALALESKLGDAGRIVYGVDYYRDDVDASTVVDRFNQGTANLISSTRSVQGPVGDDSFYDLAGVYAQARLPFGDDFELTGGARYTYAQARIGVLDDGNGGATSASRDWDAATFNLRGNLKLTEELHVYGGASQAFRAPNLDDLSALKPSRTGVISTGSIDIEPEDYLTYEIGTRLSQRDFAVQAAVFYTDISDNITSRPVGQDPNTSEIITASTNGSDGFLWGGELEASWNLDEQWRASGFVAYVDGEADTYPNNSLSSVREPVSRLMPLTAQLALRWTGDQGLWVEGRVIGADRAGRLNSGDRGDTSRFPPDGTPGYVVAFLSSGYRVNEHVELNVTLENVTNTSYRVHGSGVNQPGFNAILGGRFSW
ncbi:MAG: TonB-dependent receptor [Planctomycetota bacterium]